MSYDRICKVDLSAETTTQISLTGLTNIIAMSLGNGNDLYVLIVDSESPVNYYYIKMNHSTGLYTWVKKMPCETGETCTSSSSGIGFNSNKSKVYFSTHIHNGMLWTTLDSATGAANGNQFVLEDALEVVDLHVAGGNIYMIIEKSGFIFTRFDTSTSTFSDTTGVSGK